MNRQTATYQQATEKDKQIRNHKQGENAQEKKHVELVVKQTSPAKH